MLNRSVKTNSKLWWLSGTNSRISTTAAAPTTCHHTETFWRTSMMAWPKMLIAPCRARMITNRMNVLPRLTSMPNSAPKVRFMNVAQP